ncbi:hypothetical protein Tco_0820548 [Tanacetum coccineum]|uniref:Uncharacterized protein n=1 Tax=Tanacetum coccineum TaxID=301880 RepID=A0ABQ5AEH1_9ASTR
MFIDEVPSKTLSYEPTISSLNDEIDFRVSFDDSDDEYYMIIFEKNLFSYKIVSTNDLKTDSENDNEKVMPSIPSPEPAISCFDDLDFFKAFENEFPAIVYNDALTSKSDLLTEPILNPQHIDKFDLNDETSWSEYDEEEQNILYFNDLFPFNIIRPDDLKSKKDNDDNDIDIIQSLEGNEITHGSNMLFEISHDKITKSFRTGSFVVNLKVKTVIWRYYVNEMLFSLIMNLYVSFGIPFDPKRYYKDDDCAIMLRRPRMVMEHRDDAGCLARLRLGEVLLDLDAHDTIQFQLGGAKRRLSSRQFILALGLHTGEEMESLDFARYWSESERMIPRKGDLHDYWRDISTDGDFLEPPPSYTLIRDLMLRLCHRMMAHSIAGRTKAPEKVTVTDLFYLRGLDVGSMIDMAELFRLQICVQLDDTWAWVAMRPERQPDVAASAPRVAQDALVIDESGQADPVPVHAPPLPPPVATRTMS